MAEKEWQAIQKKAFTHWISSVLERKNETLSSIEEDFKTGVKLIQVLEILTSQEVPKYNKIAKHRLHYIENSNIALKFLQNQGVKDVSISAEEIVDGNLKMLLGMCWVLLRHFGKRQTEDEKQDGSSYEESMLSWAQTEVWDYDVEVCSFRTSFNDGHAFLALCHRLYPDSIDYDAIDLDDPVVVSKLAFQVAEEKLKVPTLLNAENLAAGKEKEKSVVLYLSLLYNAYINETDKRQAAGFSEKKTLSLKEQIKLLEEENSVLKEEIVELKEEVEGLEKKMEEEEEEKVELKEEKEEAAVKIAQEKEQLKAMKEGLEKEKEGVEKENDELTKQLKKSERQREKLEEMLKVVQKENSNTLGELQKAISIHLKQLNQWKAHFKKESKEYESDKIQALKQKEISNMDPFGQLASIVQSLTHEDMKLEVLKKEREEREAKEKEIKEKIAEYEKEKAPVSARRKK